jgi:hypothetical protein
VQTGGNSLVVQREISHNSAGVLLAGYSQPIVFSDDKVS